MIFLLIVSIFILFSLNFLMIYNLGRVFKDSKKVGNVVNISIIISAKNESKNINGLIENLTNLEYSPQSFEVIIVDDNSADDTFNLLMEQTKYLNNFSVLSLKPSAKSGKRDALSQGISNSKYPYILITDADCYPQKSWLVAYSRKFSEEYEMLFGVAPFYQNKSLVNRISCFENLRSSILSFSIALLGWPYSAAARNFGFSKKAFNALGGYSKTKDTLGGDDDLLLREAVKRKLKIGIVTDPGSFVHSKSKKTFSEYFLQKARHTQTSFHYLKKHQLILGSWHLLNLVFLFSPILMLLNPLYGILFPAKLLLDLSIVKLYQKKFSYNFSTMEITYLQIVYEIILIINFFRARFTEVKWK